ncbi:MAG TPA: hypothetical protein VEH04_01185 [Verrucomicrobiae bacterium]|nr:hypothetical protein [Verrucomicrobiae bacterium]
MKLIQAFLAILCAISSGAAATTINSAEKYAYGANIGWLNAQGDVVNGAVVGEYVCSGYVWGANVGWIHLGGGTPANGIRYQNNSATDFGVNHDGLGNLRGYAYGANIGWINFEESGAPKVDLTTGVLTGQIYSANCGWISLSNKVALVRTDIIQPGADSDGDGITDAWELSYTNSLTAFTATSDADGDGIPDQGEHVADTHPLDPGDLLRITSYLALFGAGTETNTLAWKSKESRNYQIDYRTNLSLGTPWVDATALFAPDPGMNTTRSLVLTPSLSERYFRVEAVKPLSP